MGTRRCTVFLHLLVFHRRVGDRLPSVCASMAGGVRQKCAGSLPYRSSLVRFCFEKQRVRQGKRRRHA